MLLQWLMEHLLFTLVFVSLSTIWAVMTIRDMRDWDTYYKDDDWRKR